ncbi:MAG: hypothetical protein WDO71_21490 [Bacteroidota bacterium]
MNTKHNTLLSLKEAGRRKFIVTATKAAGAAILLSSPLLSFAGSPGAGSKIITVGEIMDAFISEVPGAPFATTVDTLKAGNRGIAVTGIVTTMFATLEVIQKTIALGANLLLHMNQLSIITLMKPTGWKMMMFTGIKRTCCKNTR